MDGELELAIKILEFSQVLPPTDSIPSTLSLPLTFFDIPWLLCLPAQRLFFYKYPYSTQHFNQSTLPLLKLSLSLTLQHFFPLASTLVCPLPPSKPYILYSPGGYIPFIVAESPVDFGLVVDDHPCDSAFLHPLLPQLEGARVCHLPGDKASHPLAAIQITVFPNAGLCIGMQFRHVVCDGRSLNNFMKSWASIFRNAGSLFEVVQPINNRGAIKDLNGLEPSFLNEWWGWASKLQMEPPSTKPSKSLITHKTRATFILSKIQINQLKKWLSNQQKSNINYVSTFTAVCALTWVCFVKSKEIDNVTTSKFSQKGKTDEEIHYFWFFADCRNRLELEGSNVPETYFGNCMSFCFVKAEKDVLVAKNGVVSAAKAIGDKVKEFKEDGPLKDASKWFSNWMKAYELENLITVSGSPLFYNYDIDFGWGRPTKSHLVHIDAGRCFSLIESRDEEGGVEIGIALSQPSMDAFVSIFHQSLKLF